MRSSASDSHSVAVIGIDVAPEVAIHGVSERRVTLHPHPPLPHPLDIPSYFYVCLSFNSRFFALSLFFPLFPLPHPLLLDSSLPLESDGCLCLSNQGEATRRAAELENSERKLTVSTTFNYEHILTHLTRPHFRPEFGII